MSWLVIQNQVTYVAIWQGKVWQIVCVIHVHLTCKLVFMTESIHASDILLAKHCMVTVNSPNIPGIVLGIRPPHKCSCAAVFLHNV